MERKEIFEQVRKIVETFVDLARDNDIKAFSRLKEDLGCDSLDGVEIAIELDKAFGISTTDADVALINNGTVNDIVDLVEKYLTKKEKKS